MARSTPAPTQTAFRFAIAAHDLAASLWSACPTSDEPEAATDRAIDASDIADQFTADLRLVESPLPDADDRDADEFAEAHRRAASVLRDAAAIAYGEHPRSAKRASAALRLFGWTIRKTVGEREWRIAPKGNEDAAYYGDSLAEAVSTFAAMTQRSDQ